MDGGVKRVPNHHAAVKKQQKPLPPQRVKPQHDRPRHYRHPRRPRRSVAPQLIQHKPPPKLVPLQRPQQVLPPCQPPHPLIVHNLLLKL